MRKTKTIAVDFISANQVRCRMKLWFHDTGKMDRLWRELVEAAGSEVDALNLATEALNSRGALN